jgi:hypothetical protein
MVKSMFHSIWNKNRALYTHNYNALEYNILLTKSKRRCNIVLDRTSLNSSVT